VLSTTSAIFLVFSSSSFSLPPRDEQSQSLEKESK
jgi:hypothetical protein